RNGPDGCLPIDLVPFCRYCVAGPDGCQDLKLKSCCSGTMTLAELAHEVGQLPIWQRRIIADLANLRRGREQIIEMPLPASRVLAFKFALRLGGIDHLLDATANPAGRFGLARPDRLDDPQDQRCINRADRKITDSLAVVVLG